MANPSQIFPVTFRCEQVAPCSLSSSWVTAIAAGEVATQDAAAIQDVADDIGATRFILKRESHAGTLVMLRLAYTGTPSTDPILAVFGRTGSDAWERLITRGGTRTAELETAVATDSTDGTLYYSEVTDYQTLDCRGCDEIIVGVETAFNGSVTATAVVQAKII